MKILVVDDEPLVLESCRRVLEDEGYSVHLVNSADRAIEALNAGLFDLLLVDIKMPGRNGLDLIREIKEKWPQTPVIVMTGYSTPEMIIESYRAGSDKFIMKPFTPDELSELVRQIRPKEERR